MKSETRTIVCKQCGLPKEAFMRGYFPNFKDKRWVDKEERQFSGLTCPDCQVRRSKTNMKKLRDKNEVR